MKAFLSFSSGTAGKCFRISKACFHTTRSSLERKKEKIQILPGVEPVALEKMEEQPNYKAWTHESLIDRVTQLEKELKEKTSRFISQTPKTWKKIRAEREFDHSKYSTRLIALKIAYLGNNYNGFEYHTNNTTPLPTIEEELWKALSKAKLISPTEVKSLQPGEVNWEDCEYSKCGRTDKGVSAFGQVIGIRVRSNRPLIKQKVDTTLNLEESQALNHLETSIELASPPLSTSFASKGNPTKWNLTDEVYEDALNFDPILDEIPYLKILNRLLPPDIRVLAWCPSLPLDFSARFSCRERQYKYFFTQPAFAPMPSHLDAAETPNTTTIVKDGWLDIAAMRDAASRFVGLHDFRNFCKVDASKQIDNFERRIFHADIVEVKDTTSTLGFVNDAGFSPKFPINGVEGSVNALEYPKVYAFTLHGSAFLWHQVRHMVAVLFLVGQGLESPSIISELLDVQSNPRRPSYELAVETPLVLWDCIFPQEDDKDRKNAIEWVYVGDEPGRGDDKYGKMGLMEDVWALWRGRKMDEILTGSLIDVIHSQGKEAESLTSEVRQGPKSQRVFDGGNRPRLQGKYIPVMKKPLLDKVEMMNERYIIRKGWETTDELKEQGFRRPSKFDQRVDHVKD